MPPEEDRNGSINGLPPPRRPAATRPLTAAADPARRLQELLREEASPEVGLDEEPPAPEPPPLASPIPAAEAKHTAPPPAPAVDPPPPVAMVRLSVMLDGSRLETTEYPGREALPTRLQLEQTHRAYILRDQWLKADTIQTWVVYMKRKTR